MIRRLLDIFRKPQPATGAVNSSTPRDYEKEREDRRLSNLSDADKAWSDASQQRDRETRGQNQ